MKLLLIVITFISVVSVVRSAELDKNFPPDVAQFIADRKSCDYFNGEPRDFDESYKREHGKQAEVEEAERAAFLEQATKKACNQMDERLRKLNKKYRANKFVADELATFAYLKIGSGYVFIHKDFPNANLILEKLGARGFMPYDLKLMKGVDRHRLNWERPLPEKLTIQIGSLVDVFPAQLAIETLLEFGSKDIGVVLLPKGDGGLGLSMFVGIPPIGNYQVISGGGIEDLLAPGLSKEEFRKLAK